MENSKFGNSDLIAKAKMVSAALNKMIVAQKHWKVTH